MLLADSTENYVVLAKLLWKTKLYWKLLLDVLLKHELRASH
jgi:hypothetical protein